MSARLFFWIKLLLALLTLGYLGHIVEPEAIVGAARKAEPIWIVAAVALVPLNLGLEAYRWHRLVRRLAPEVRLGQSLGAVLSGYPLGLATPGRVGDYVGRALYLPQAGAWELAALTFAERMATLACCLVFGLAALVPFALTHGAAVGGAWRVVLVAGALGAGVLLAALLNPRAAGRRLAAALPWARARELLAVLGRLGPREATTLLALSAVRYAVFSAQFGLLVLAFEPGARLGLVAAGVALTYFAKSAIPSVTLADLGIREGAAVFFFGALGLSGAAAFDAAFLVFCVNILLPAAAGLPLMLRWREAEAAEALPAEAPS